MKWHSLSNYASREKKQNELSVLNDFKSHYPDFPKGKIRKTESPDFVVETGLYRRIGIELTLLLPSDSPAHSHSYKPAGMSREILELTIARKEEKLPLYRGKRLDNIWLVIITGESEQSPEMNVMNRIGNRDFGSRFDRVFLFDARTEQVHILK